MQRHLNCFLCLVLLMGCWGAVQAGAQERFPTRPILMIMPSPPGGGTDILGRILAGAIDPFLGQKMVVENKPGAGATLGIGTMVASKPDGYTIAATSNGAVTSAPHVMKLHYGLDALTPLLQVGASSYVVCAGPDFPANTAEELIAHLKANPNKYTLGNDGVGGTMQIAAERILGHFGAKTRPVPYGGAGETARALLGGHVDLYGGSIVAILAHVKAGKAKCLMLTSADDNPTLPQTAGLRRLGVPELDTVLWWMIITPRNVPADRLVILRDAFRKAADTPMYREALATLGASPTFRQGEDLERYLKKEYDTFGEVIHSLGLDKKAQ